ncbi:hypothetical protein BKA62DRAFT_831094 [Auriculariales sp. MPI-PUGE-AT-0066]|nr:hypothetical protein BKA62DRAFT_831094 [Auriculariales sp. MPI-PUGE-AT-0066]
MGVSPLRALAAAMACAAMATLSCAKSVTIDDIDKQWSYTPPGAWGAISKANPCEECQTQPNPDDVYGGTWHDLSQIGSATLSVVAAQSISLYAICPGATVDGGHYRLNVTILLDGAQVATFQSPEGGCSDYQYNYLIYEDKTLDLKEHAVQVLNHIQDTQLPDSNLLIDYAVIDDGKVDTTASSTDASGTSPATASSNAPSSSQPSEPSSKSSVPIAAIIIPIVVAVVAVALIAFLLIRSRRRRQRDDAGRAPIPFDQDPRTRPYDGRSLDMSMREISSPTYSGGIHGAPRSQYSDDQSIYSQPRPAGGHDPQLEAALAIIADRAARAQAADAGPSVPPVPVHSAAYQSARRGEKSRYRNEPEPTTPSLTRSASMAHSAAHSMGSSGVGPTTAAGSTEGWVQPPSYVESTVPRTPHR